MKDTFSEIKEIIIEVLKPEADVANSITPDTRFIEDLHADSMDLFFMVDLICDKYGIDVDSDKASEIHTVKDVVALIDSLK